MHSLALARIYATSWCDIERLCQPLWTDAACWKLWRWCICNEQSESRAQFQLLKFRTELTFENYWDLQEGNTALDNAIKNNNWSVVKQLVSEYPEPCSMKSKVSLKCNDHHNQPTPCVSRLMFCCCSGYDGSTLALVNRSLNYLISSASDMKCCFVWLHSMKLIWHNLLCCLSLQAEMVIYVCEIFEIE